MAIKAGIYIGDQLTEIIGPTGNGGLSRRINIIGDRYAEILRRAQIERRFSGAEWNLLRDSLNGTIHEPAAMIRALSAGVEDSIAMDGLAKKWAVDGEAIISKMRALSYVEEVAVVEAVESWWAKNATSD